MVDGVSPAAAAWSAVADATGIGHGTAVLDIGCGTGGFCRYAASRGARVHGADADPERIATARDALGTGDFRMARAERLPWPDGTFDVVTGFNVFQYAADVPGALAEARRVARTAGHVAACKWGPPATNAFFAFLGVLEPLRLGLRDLPATDPLDVALERLQVDVVAAGVVPAPITLRDDGALTAALAAAGARAEPARVVDVASPYRQGDGSYRFDNRLVYRVFVA
jgi:SAM-dependent methyltransferase